MTSTLHPYHVSSVSTVEMSSQSVSSAERNREGVSLCAFIPFFHILVLLWGDQRKLDLCTQCKTGELEIHTHRLCTKMQEFRWCTSSCISDRCSGLGKVEVLVKQGLKFATAQVYGACGNTLACSDDYCARDLPRHHFYPGATKVYVLQVGHVLDGREGLKEDASHEQCLSSSAHFLSNCVWIVQAGDNKQYYRFKQDGVACFKVSSLGQLLLTCNCASTWR